MDWIDDEKLRDRIDVFRDRTDAGAALARLMPRSAGTRRILAIPAGGVPVALEMARLLEWPLDVAVVSKITLPWNTEAGYGAVAFDGSVLLNEELVRLCDLSEGDVARGVANTRRKVERRARRLRGSAAPLALDGEAVVLVDDGLASGFTMLAAIQACRRAGAGHLTVAVPTGHTGALDRVGARADLVVCANVRGGPRFAVADAYLHWTDVPEAIAELQLERARGEVHAGR